MSFPLLLRRKGGRAVFPQAEMPFNGVSDALAGAAVAIGVDGAGHALIGRGLL